MKKIMTFFVMVLGIIMIMGCDPDRDQKKPVLQSFDVTIDDATKTSVTYSITPAVLDAAYMAVVKTADSVEGLDDETLVENIFSDIESLAGQKGLTLSEYLANNSLTGITDKAVVKGLAVDTEYVLVVLGVDLTSGVASTYPFVETFTTAAVSRSECTFDVSAEVNMNTVDFSVVPSDENVIWHLVTLKKSDYDAYLDPAGDYKWDKATLYQAYVDNETMQYLSAGYSAAEAFEAMYLTGSAELHAEGLNIQTEYVWLVAGFDSEDNVAYLATDVMDGTYLTGNVAKSDMTFDISVTDVEQMRAAIKITPSSDEEPFCWMVQKYDGVQTAEEVMNNIVSANQMWFDMGFMLYYGVQDYTGGEGSPYKYALDMPGTDYCVIAFGYSGGINTEPEMVTFTTLPGGNPADCTFEADVTKTSPYSVEFDLVPSDITVYYTADVCLASEFDADAIAGELEAGIESLLQMQQMFDPNATVSQVVSNYYWSGANSMTANNLEPDTEYMLYVCALDANTGKVVNVVTIDSFARTSALGTVVPTVELVGYYSGDDEAGSIFGQPEATAGKSIAVVKYNVAEAATLYSSIITGNAMDVAENPDSYLMSIVTSYYWAAMDMNQPYSFFVVDWEVENTVLAYAEDAEGRMGSLARRLICATAAEKSDILELETLVNSLNAESGKTAYNAAPVAKSASSEPCVILRKKISSGDEMPILSQQTVSPRRTLKAGNVILLDYIPSLWM